MGDVITRERRVIDSAQWIDSSNGEIVEAVKLSDLDAVPRSDLTAATAHAADLAAEVERARDEIRCRKLPVSEERPLHEHVDAALDYVISQKESAEKRASEAEAQAAEWSRLNRENLSEADSLRSKLEEAEAMLRQHDAVVAAGNDAMRAIADKYAALESAAREWRTDSTARAELALATAIDALSAPAPGAAEPESWPCSECELNKNGICESAGMTVENEKDDEPCCDFIRRTPAPAKPETCGECVEYVGNYCCSKHRPVRREDPVTDCDKGTRRLPVVAKDRPPLCDASLAEYPRPAAQGVGNG